jgi:acetyl esterase/lipase
MLVLKKKILPFLVAVFLLSGCASETNRVMESASWKSSFAKTYSAELNIPYGKVPYKECKVDVYFIKKSHPIPVLLFFHGGGWVKGSKDEMTFSTYMKAGWGIVNAEYRFANTSSIKAPVVDCRAALSWVYAHANEFNFDTSKILISGSSAGAHLALFAGLAGAHSEFDDNCEYSGDLKVAAIINNFGPTDLVKLLTEPKVLKNSGRWFNGIANIEELARKISPVNYVKPGSPPVFTAHGDKDPTVPYDQALRLKKVLDDTSIPNELITVHGGGHGKFSDADKKEINKKLSLFLKKQADVDLSGSTE